MKLENIFRKLPFNRLVKFESLLIIVVLIFLTSCKSKRTLPVQCEQKPKYSKIFDLPEELIGYNNYDQAIDCSKKTGKPLAIYFTATKCGHCDKFETEFLNSHEISKIINEDFVFVALFVDDKTELPKGDQFEDTDNVSGYKRKIRNIGHLNCTLLPKFMHSSQPALFITNKEDSVIAHIDYDSNIQELKDEFRLAVEKKNH